MNRVGRMQSNVVEATQQAFAAIFDTLAEKFSEIAANKISHRFVIGGRAIGLAEGRGRVGPRCRGVSHRGSALDLVINVPDADAGVAAVRGVGAELQVNCSGRSVGEEGSD